MQFISPYVERDVQMKFTAAAIMNWMFKKQDGCLQFSIRKTHYTSYRKMFPFPRPFSECMPSPSCISMKTKIKWLVHYTSSTEALPCLGVEETTPEAELPKDIQSQQGTKQLSLLTGWKLNMQEFCFELEKEKRNVACASPQNLPLVFPRQISKLQWKGNFKAQHHQQRTEFCCDYE